ncbi:MAG: YidH family protein [Acidiferrobacteraceae bacterium]
MIRNLRDRLANERTYLASLRTGIAVMAFGFLVERFNIFLSYIGKSLGAHPASRGQSAARVIGVGLILAGVLAMVVSTVRYVLREREIRRDVERNDFSLVPDILLGLLLAGLGVFLAFYLLHIGVR